MARLLWLCSDCFRPSLSTFLLLGRSHRVSVMGSSPQTALSHLWQRGAALPLTKQTPTSNQGIVSTCCPVLSSCAEEDTGDTWGEEGLWLPLSLWAVPTMGYERYHPQLNAGWAADLSWHWPQTGWAEPHHRGSGPLVEDSVPPLSSKFLVLENRKFPR